MNLLSSAAPRRKTTRQRVGALALSALVLASSAVVGGVASAQAASNISTGPLNIVLGVGADESQRMVSWYFPTNVNQALELEKTADLAGGAFNASKQVIAASKALNTAADTSATDSESASIPGIANQSGYINAHATIKNLQPNTTYSYHVGAADGTSWSPTYTFSTKSFTGDFDFLFFGDPQVGSSGSPDLDGAGWAATLEYATAQTPNAELLVSGGDQVEKANNEYEWSAFSDSSTVLKKYAWASTIGNHDVGGKAYEQHNSLPNNLKTADYYRAGDTAATSGGDYWYVYKGVLFIDINSNAYAAGADAAHVNFVRGVIGKVGDAAKWTVLVYHHSIYSPADHANDTDNQQRRFDFTTAFSQLGVDMVLQGHDHSYSRSYSILNGKKANANEQPAANEVFAGPGGVIYVTANSASGSKYYDLTTPDASLNGYGPDPLDPSGKRHWANSVENQEHVRTYIKVSVTDSKLDVTNVRAGDCTAPNAAVTRGNVSTCGVTLKPTASNDAAPIGSIVDHFTLDAAVPATTTTLVASQASTVVGSTTPITLTSTVSGGLGALTGTVGFYDGSTLLGTSPLSGGKASYALPAALAVGQHSYTARFTSGSAFTGTDSTSTAAAVTVAKAASTTALAYANGVATVTATAPGVAVAGSATIFDGAKPVATVAVVNGTASAEVAVTGAGAHALRAEFAATDTIAASTSNVVTVTVAASTDDEVTATAAKSTTTVKYSEKVITVTVKAKGATATGSVKIYDGSKLLKTVKIVKGKATLKVTLKKGTHKVKAVFAATEKIAKSTSKTISVKIAK